MCSLLAHQFRCPKPSAQLCCPCQQDPYDTLVRRFMDMGFTRDEVAMGLAIAGPDAADDADKIGAAFSSGLM